MSQCFVNCLWTKKNIIIFNVKSVDYRWVLWNISINKAINIINNYVLEGKGVL